MFSSIKKIFASNTSLNFYKLITKSQIMKVVILNLNFNIVLRIIFLKSIFKEFVKK